jgi:hypothetical protein
MGRRHGCSDVETPEVERRIAEARDQELRFLRGSRARAAERLRYLGQARRSKPRPVP